MAATRESRAAAVVFALSIVAAFVIEYLLYTVYRGGAIAAFTPPTSLLFLPLVAIATAVWRGLRVFAVNARWAVERVLPAGIAGAFLAFLMTLEPGLREPSMYLISLVYLAELFVGVKLYRDIEGLSRPGAALFVGGMALFILTLPLSIYIRQAALLPMAFNAVKTLGLAILLAAALRSPGWRPPRPGAAAAAEAPAVPAAAGG